MSAPGPAESGRRLPRLHAVTDDEVLATPGWVERATAALGAGGADLALHLRGPHTDPGRLVDLLDTLLEPASSSGALLLVNDRVDVALVGGARGVHLGERSLPAERARALLGKDAWIGVSCHDASEARGPAAEGADSVFLGTIHPTATHPGAVGLGLDAVRRAVAVGGEPPLIGIGGIGLEKAPGVVAAGAYGVAAIRGIWRAEDPAEAVTQYLEGLSGQGEETWKRRKPFISA
ncbi:MAG: thiamine phosphate synthase [Gemmatimonadota bacterium]